MLALNQSGYAFRRAARIAARGLGARRALVIVRREGRIHVAGSHGFDTEAGLRDDAVHPFLSAVIGNPGVAVRDAREHPTLARSTLVAGPGGIRYAAGVSVIDVEYVVCGAVWVLDPEPRAAGADDLTFLNDIASIVASYILPAHGDIRAERAEQRLVEAVEALSDGFVYFDAEDRLVLCNQRYREIYAESAHAIRPGVRFEELLRAGLAQGQYPDAVGREEEWLAERLGAHAQARSVLEQRLPNGRWLRIEEKIAPSRGRVGLRVDITELKQQQIALETARAELALRNAELERQVEERNAKIEAQRRAAEAEALLRDAIEAMRDGFVFYDAEDRLVVCNQRYREMFSSSAHLLVPGTRFVDILRNELAAGKVLAAEGRWDAWIAERLAARNGPQGTWEHELGGGLWIRTVDVPVAGGGLVGLRIDISDLKREQFALEAARAELALRNAELERQVEERNAKIEAQRRAAEAEALLRDAIEAIPDGFVFYDAKDELALWNKKFADLYALSDLRPNMPFEEVIRRGVANGQYPEAVGREEEWIAARLEAHRNPGRPTIQQHPGGRWIRVEERPMAGGRVGLRVDITELKEQQLALERARAELALHNADLARQVEERNAKIEAQRRATEAEALLREAIEAMADGFVYFDRDDRFVMCNRRYREMFACSHPLMVPGALYVDILRHDLDTGSVPDAVGREEEWLAERLAARAAGRRDFEQHLRSDLWVRTVDVRTADGGYVGLAIDVTDFKRQQFALMAAREELEQQNEHLAEKVAERTAKIAEQAAALEVALEQEREAARAQRQFVAMVSHEFRTPLAIIDAAASRVGRRSAKEGVAWTGDYVEQMRGAVRRLIKLIESVLGAAKADAGTIEMNPVPVDLAEMVHAICADQRRVTPDRPFEVRVEGPASVVADQTLAYQVLVNLIGNAVKYSPPASPVTIRLRCEGDDVAVDVSDQGVGIPADEIPRLFERFFRASTASGIAGTGLGLNLSREIARMHGGDISLASTVGEGSTFTLRLRVAGPPAAATLPQASVA